MVWAIQVTLDDGRTDIGTIAGTYTDTNINFTFSERNALNVAGLNLFLAHAKAAYTKQQIKAAAEVALSTQATALANKV